MSYVQSTPWLAWWRPNPEASVRLFCFPYGGGGANAYRSWQTAFEPNIEVCPVQLPGRENRLHEPLFTRLSPLVEVLADVLTPYLDRPFAFFGHSLGAMIGFELARRIEVDSRIKPLRLFVSGRRAPQEAETDPPIYHLPHCEFLLALSRLGATRKDVLENAELMSMLGPILRADYEVFQTHKYFDAPLLSCPITAFGGLDDQDETRERLAGWHSHTSASFSLHMLPGDHFFLHTATPLLIQRIIEELREDAPGDL
jgi:medium-chain acyl-[acyl-carrier-protein] hydrolase